MGSPAPSDVLTDTFGITFIGTGVGVTLLSSVDRAPDGEGLGDDHVVGSCAGAEPESPGVRLRMSTLTPKRGRTVTATASLVECEGHEGTNIRLQRRRDGRFRNVATKQLNSDCRALFSIKAGFRKATFRALWPKQDEDHARGVSRRRYEPGVPVPAEPEEKKPQPSLLYAQAAAYSPLFALRLHGSGPPKDPPDP